MIVFCCPSCRNNFQVTDDLSGKMIACPGCRQALVVPARPVPAIPAVPPPPSPAPASSGNGSAPGRARPPADIFVSYARKDDAVVYPIATRLSSQGVRLWIDKLDLLPGDCFRTEISRAIDRCKVFLFMCSAQSLASDFCFKEMAYASTKKRPIDCLWLCPPFEMPGMFALELGPRHQVVLANRPPESWLPELLAALGKHRVEHRGTAAPGLAPSAKLQQQRLAIQQACQRRDWQAALDQAETYLEAMPNDAEVVTLASTARQWLSYEQNQHFSRIQRSRSAREWADFLARYPDGPGSDHARRKIAHLLPIPELEPYLRSCQRSAADDPQALGWCIAAVVCLFRLGNYGEAGAILDEVRKVAPRDAEMLFFSVVGALHDSRPGTLTPNRVQTFCKHVQVVMELAPDCGLPWLVAGLLARDYCEPYGLACPLGSSSQLFNRANEKGTTADDLQDLQALVSKPMAAPPIPALPSQPPPLAPSRPPASAGSPPSLTSAAAAAGASTPASAGALSSLLAAAGGKATVLVGTVCFCVGVATGVGGMALFNRPKGSSDPLPALRGARAPFARADVHLTVGDFVELRTTSQMGDKFETVGRFEVVKIEGSKYQLLYTTSIAGNPGLTQRTEHDLNHLLAANPADLTTVEQFNQMNEKILLNGKPIRMVSKTRKNWTFKGKEYPCVVKIIEHPSTGVTESWVIDDPYFRALMLSGEVRTVMGTGPPQEVTDAHFAARP